MQPITFFTSSCVARTNDIGHRHRPLFKFTDAWLDA
jgi:hypothetical protein